MSADLGAPDLVLTGRFKLGEERHYRHAPFTVPAGVQQLHLRCRYNDRIDSNPLVLGGNTLDIGVFDERGTASSGPGFRGWSGSARDEITIDRDWATPPYLPGAPGAGEWNLLLGPYKIGPAGLDYTIELWFDAGLPPARPVARVSDDCSPLTLPAPAEPGWYRGDLHCHTVYSDGDSTPGDILRTAAATGLDFLAITDHNGINAYRTGAAASGPGLPVVVPGTEVTTYRGHWNVWGAARWYDFRDPSPSGVEAAMRAAMRDGCFVSVNHPKPFGPDWDYPWSGARHGMEVWNGAWETLNSLALERWEERLRAGERVVAVGGSDTHRLASADRHGLFTATLGTPTMWIYAGAELAPAALLEGLLAGACFISATPAGPELYINRLAGAGGARVRVVGAAGATVQVLAETGCVQAAAIPAPDWTLDASFPPGARYLRAQVLDGYGRLLALANPVWAEARP